MCPKVHMATNGSGALSHPHICALYDFGSDNGIDYLVMEYFDGDALAERLIAGATPPFGRAPVRGGDRRRARPRPSS